MQQRMMRYVSVMCLLVISACVGSVPLADKNKGAIRCVCISEHVQMPEVMFYRGPEFALEAFGVVGSVAADNIKMKNEEKLAVLMRKRQIDVAQIARDNFVSAIEAQRVFPSIVSDGGDATITLTVKTYGLAYGLSSDLKPMLGIEGCLIEPGGSTLWRKYAYVSNLSDQTPSYTFGELVSEPERIRQLFEVSAQIVTSELVRHMQGY